MTSKTKPSPTELAILKILWAQEPLSAREVHSEIEKKLDWSNSSTRKTLERMSNKNFLKINGLTIKSNYLIYNILGVKLV